MDVRLREENALNETEVETIKGLLVQGFPDEPCFADRIYYKQIPHCRVLAEIDGIIVGQCGLDHRVISTSEGPARVFGVIDVCVAKSRRGKGLALEILQWVEELAVRSNVDFLMLFASDPRLYLRAGYQSPKTVLRWVAIDEHECHGVFEEQESGNETRAKTCLPSLEGQ